MNRDRLIVIAFIIVAIVIYQWNGAVQKEALLVPLKASIIASQKPRVYHFYATWCGPCKAFEPILKEALRPYGDTIDCKDLNIDEHGNMGFLWHAFDSGGVPTTVIFDRYGHQVAKIVGGESPEELDKYLRQAVKYQ